MALGTEELEWQATEEKKEEEEEREVGFCKTGASGG